MSRYGKEDDHFVLELVYNYTINTYSMGNNFQVPVLHIDIQCTQISVFRIRLDFMRIRIQFFR
jgi:hypothetical protein